MILLFARGCNDVIITEVQLSTIFYPSFLALLLARSRYFSYGTRWNQTVGLTNQIMTNFFSCKKNDVFSRDRQTITVFSIHSPFQHGYWCFSLFSSLLLFCFSFHINFISNATPLPHPPEPPNIHPSAPKNKSYYQYGIMVRTVPLLLLLLYLLCAHYYQNKTNKNYKFQITTFTMRMSCHHQ